MCDTIQAFPPNLLSGLQGDAASYTLVCTPAHFYVMVDPYGSFGRTHCTATVIVFIDDYCIIVGSARQHRSCGSLEDLANYMILECRKQLPLLCDAVAVICPVIGFGYDPDQLSRTASLLKHCLYRPYSWSAFPDDFSRLMAPLFVYLEQRRVVFHSPLVGENYPVRFETFRQLGNAQLRVSSRDGDLRGHVAGIELKSLCHDLFYALGLSWHCMDFLGQSLLGCDSNDL